MNFEKIKLHIAQNWKSGITVSLVSLPLSISLAVAANATPAMGVITAIWAGLFAAAFGGSHFNVTGPTGALSGILAMYAILYGVSALPLLAVLTGIIILIYYIFRLERYIVLIPASVIHGFTLGVAFIIGLNQFNFAFGLKNLPSHELFIDNVIESFKHIGFMEPWTFVIFIVATILLFVILKLFPKVPGPIIIAPIGILLGYFSQVGIIDFPLQTLYTKFGDIPSQIINFQFLNLSVLNFDLIKAAIAISIVAVLETLISAKIADGMTKTRFHQRKEVFGLSLANIASGLTGGIPATAALARTALNVKTGANHKTSGIINAVVVAIISLLLLPSFKYLPLPIVAAILVYVAVRMVEVKHLKHLLHHDKTTFVICIIVALVTIIEDPIVGILVGASVSLIIFVNNISKAQGEMTLSKEKQMVARVHTDNIQEGIETHSPDTIIYRIAGQLNYINAQSHREKLHNLGNEVHTVVLNFRNLFYIDIDGLEAVQEMIDDLETKNISVKISSVNDCILPLLEKSHWFTEKVKNNKVYNSVSEIFA